jgi:hypothetical protein
MIGFLPLFIFISYYPLLTSGSSVDPDAQIIIPNLEAGNYFLNLFNLKTIDFQPVRDLTLRLDMWIFNTFDFRTIIIQNFLWWLGCCLMIYLILKELHQKTKTSWPLVLSVFFGVYPLFVPVVGWGMSRKHLLSFFFILIATFEILRVKDLNLKASLKIATFFLLSVLSQPITILWSVWALIFLGKRFPRFTLFKFLAPSFAVTALITIVNYIYYEYSEVFKHHFESKTSEALNIPDKLLALGHYFFQLFFPYQLSFKYELGDYQVLIGLIPLAIILFLCYKIRSFRALALGWLSLGFLTLVVILNTPNVLSDSYLLVPAFTLLVVVSNYLPNKTLPIFVPIIIALSLYSHIESKNWLNPILLTEVSFDRRPNCRNALNYSRMNYEEFKKGPPAANEYILRHECLKNQAGTQYSSATNINFLGYMFFHEDEIPLDIRINTLEQFSRTSLIAEMTLAGLFIKMGDNERARETINEIIIKAKKIEISGKEFHTITAYVVQPYCEKEKWQECLEITSKFSRKMKTIY